jgi:hypothetical protein
MIDRTALGNAGIEELKGWRRYLTRIIGDCERAAIIAHLPVLEVVWTAQKWEDVPEHMARGQLTSITRTTIGVRDEETGRERWVPIRRIVEINGISTVADEYARVRDILGKEKFASSCF